MNEFDLTKSVMAQITIKSANDNSIAVDVLNKLRLITYQIDDLVDQVEEQCRGSERDWLLREIKDAVMEVVEIMESEVYYD